MSAPRLQAGASMSIGTVLSRLKPEFPDVTISKLRYLETEGLVEPERTNAGYRQFSHGDVERLRYVLRAQRDHYLPLKVIKEQLDAIERGLEPATPAPRLPRSLVAASSEPAPEIGGGPSVAMTRVELLADSGLTTEQLREIESFGLVTVGANGYYDADTAMIARTVSELLRSGLEPRHLRAFRTAADREASLVAQLLAPSARQRDPDARERAVSAAAALASVTLTLHANLVKSALRRELGT